MSMFRRSKQQAEETPKNLQEVEFWPAGQWPTDNIIWPEDIIEEEEENG